MISKKIPKFKYRIFFALVFVFSSLCLVPSAQAAKIIFEPSGGTYTVGDTFSVKVKIDTEGETINAVDLGIIYPPLLAVKKVTKGPVIQLWVQDPSFTKSEISITGGIPGGAQSKGGLIATITFDTKAVGEGSLGFRSDSAVLLNDGQGTKASLQVMKTLFTIIARPKATATPSKTPELSPTASSSPTPSPSLTPSPSVDPGQYAYDTTKPNRFSITVGRDPSVFNEKYFGAFFTRDEQSGMDHYEIKEGSDEQFRVAKAPYLLSDQNLKTVIRVRAYDNAGNYRESVYPNIFKRFWWWLIHIFS